MIVKETERTKLLRSLGLLSQEESKNSLDELNILGKRLSSITQNKSDLYKEYKNKLETLIKNEEKTLRLINDKKEIDSNKVENYINNHIEKLGLYEESLNDQKNPEIESLLLHANKLYRELQSKYISRKFDDLNKKLDEKISDAENSTSELMFNIISIFLGISITSAMVAGLEFISGTFVVFYFLSCAWIALTILTISSLMLRRLDKRNVIVIIIWSVYTILWVITGLISYNVYKEESEHKSIQEVKSDSNSETINEIDDSTLIIK